MKSILLLLSIFVVSSVSRASSDACVLIALNASQRAVFAQYGQTPGWRAGCLVVQQDTGDIYEWNGTDYTLLIPTAGSGSVVTAPASSSRNIIQPTLSTVIPVTIKGAASQSADLLDLKNSAGTILSHFDSSGNLTASTVVASLTGHSSLDLALTGGILQPSAAANIPLKIKGFSGQSADLLDVTDSAGTALMTIDSVGQLSLPNVGSNVGIDIVANDNIGLQVTIGDGDGIIGTTTSPTGIGIVAQSIAGTGLEAVTDTGVAGAFAVNNAASTQDIVQVFDSSSGLASTVKMINVKNHSNSSVFSVAVNGNVANAGTIVSAGSVSAPNLNFVGVRAHNATATVSGTPSLLTYTTVDWDDGSGYSAGVYTVPAGKGGKFNVIAQVTFLAAPFTLGDFVEMAIYKNGVLWSRTEWLAPVSNGAYNFMIPPINDDVSAAAGETIEIRVSSSAAATILSSDSLNFLSIKRIPGS